VDVDEMLQSEPVAETEAESRQVRRAKARKDEKDKKRKAQLAGAPVKKQRRGASLRGQVKTNQQVLGGLLVKLRELVAELQQQRDLTNIVLSILSKQALGRATPQDLEVLDDFLEQEDDGAVEEKPVEEPFVPAEPDAGPGADVQPGG
jgi:hypothetical protein